MDKLNINSLKPYLLNAFYNWLIDNQLTPHLLVNINTNNAIIVPLEYSRDGQIILNISPSSVSDFILNNDFVSFKARFGNKLHNIYIPVASVIAIYARENGIGTKFENDSNYALVSTKKNNKLSLISNNNFNFNKTSNQEHSHKKTPTFIFVKK
ncbi:MAG: ClpXP protease specificity-enhancing factor [Pantoea sp. Brub]|nr:ClpXP protease specificity-enhancing factor [Pantoea sp. Brub]